MSSSLAVLGLREEFLLKTDNRYLKRKLLYSPWQTLRIPSALTLIDQLHQSPPSSIPGDLLVTVRGPSQQSHVTFGELNSCELGVLRF